jgi:hypothetical protein
MKEAQDGVLQRSLPFAAIRAPHVSSDKPHGQRPTLALAVRSPCNGYLASSQVGKVFPCPTLCNRTYFSTLLLLLQHRQLRRRLSFHSSYMRHASSFTLHRGKRRPDSTTNPDTLCFSLESIRDGSGSLRGVFDVAIRR